MRTQEQERNYNLAKIIQQQLFMGGKMIVFSWGSCNYKAIKNGLQFNVNGFRLKNGIVQIILDEGKDLYIINFIKRNLIIKTITEVFFEDLTSFIDREVELTENYNKDVENAVYQF